MTTLAPPSYTEALYFVRASRSPRLRTMREFAEAEIVIPSGPFEGRRYRCDRQPFTSLWFDAVDSGRWNRMVATGPSQSSKTLSCSIVPTLFHLFEHNETVIYGLPNVDMAADKWRRDLLPAIERTRYRELLPRTGAASKGGTPIAIRFGNGAELRFMSGGGSDKSRAGYTARVVVITETDGLDESGEASRESDPVSQLEARQRAFGSRKRTYMECTVSIEEGRTWRELKAGTDSRIVLPCPHCREWVSPERENLVGWKDAENEIEAREQSSFACPKCGVLWSESERIDANRGGLLIHRGQTPDLGGRISGVAPQTNTLGFRWSAVNNLFRTAADIGEEEWKAARATDYENAEKELRQFTWCLPYIPPKIALTNLDSHAISRRISEIPRGIVPTGAVSLTTTIDIGKWLCHWLAIAWVGETGHVVDYGRFDVPTSDLGVEHGILTALRSFRDSVCETGWKTAGGGLRKPDQVWIDCRYIPDSVYALCRESGDRYRPSMGRGAGRDRTRYTRPKKTTDAVKFIGAEYHVVYAQKERLWIVEVNADHWKGVAQDRFGCVLDSPAAIKLYKATPMEHIGFAKHMTAEKKVEEFVAGKGTEIKWVCESRQNHWLDCCYNNCAAGHFCAYWLTENRPQPKQEGQERMESFQTPYGDRFVMERD